MSGRPIHPLELAAGGLCSCLKCRSPVRAAEDGRLLSIRPEARMALFRAWPELIRSAYAPVESGPGGHRC